MPHKDPEARKLWQKQYRARKPEDFIRRSREFRARNLDRVRIEQREYQKAYYHAKLKNDPIKAAVKCAKAAAWYLANKEKAKRRIASYRRNAVIVKQQTPKWANLFFISEIYDLSKRRTQCLGIPHEVDHVIPLRGKLVCGLHVENNLSIVTKSFNRAKSARFMETENAI